jgi:hypothetical protein
MSDYDDVSKARPKGLTTGSVIRLASKLNRPRGQDPVPAGTLLVVIADKFDKVNVTVLGGDGPNYWRVPVLRRPGAATEITLVDPKSITVA